MKSKPVVMEHFSTVHTSYILNFDLGGCETPQTA